MIEKGILCALLALAILATLPRVGASLANTFETLAHATQGGPALTVKDSKQ